MCFSWQTQFVTPVANIHYFFNARPSTPKGIKASPPRIVIYTNLWNSPCMSSPTRTINRQPELHPMGCNIDIFEEITSDMM